MKLYMTRHGQTQLNAERKFQGTLDNPLNEAGTEQAEALAKKIREMGLRFDAIYSSPLQRASMTAQIIADELGSGEVICDERLIEQCFGELEGKPIDSVSKEKIRDMFLNDEAMVPGLESPAVLRARVRDIMDEIAVRHKDSEAVLIVGHSSIVRMAFGYAENSSEGMMAGNCELLPFEYKDGRYIYVGEERQVFFK